MNNQRKSNMNLYNDDFSPIDNYDSLLKTEPPSKYYINMINHDQNHFDFGINSSLYSSIQPFHYSQDKNKYSRFENNYPKTIPYDDNINYNTFTNIKEFSFWDKNLSNLSLNKYKIMREKNNFRTLLNDTDSYRNSNKNNFPNIINEYNNKEKNLYIYHDSEKNNDITIKVKNKNSKNKIKLNKEIINYNNLEKKINKRINKNRSKKKLKEFKKNYYSINFNNDEYKNRKKNLLNELLIKKIKIGNIHSNKKLKRIKGDEDDIINSYKTIKRNTTFEYNGNTKEKDEKLSSNFIKYLKKDNQKLLNINSIYKQLIDTFFYFVNQLSKKYSFKKDIKDVNYYLSNANYLSNILIDLEQHLNKMFKSNLISSNQVSKKDININDDKENEADNEQELLTKSKFISLKLDDKIKNIKLEKPFKTRNEQNKKEYLTMDNKSVFSAKNIVNKTLQNNSLNYFNNYNEGIVNEYKINNKLFKIKRKRNNGRLIKALNKINFGFFSPNNQSQINKKFNNKNKINCNDFQSKIPKISESNDLKSIINPIYIKDNSYKN